MDWTIRSKIGRVGTKVAASINDWWKGVVVLTLGWRVAVQVPILDIQ